MGPIFWARLGSPRVYGMGKRLVTSGDVSKGTELLTKTTRDIGGAPRADRSPHGDRRISDDIASSARGARMPKLAGPSPCGAA